MSPHSNERQDGQLEGSYSLSLSLLSPLHANDTTSLATSFVPIASLQIPEDRVARHHPTLLHLGWLISHDIVEAL